MTRPVVSDTTERLYQALGPFTEGDEAGGWVLLKLCDVVTAPIADVEYFAADTDTAVGWSVMLDPTLAPERALPWLGQLVGAVVPVGSTEADARAIVRAVPTWARGTPAAIVAAVRLLLTGTKSATLTERYGGSAYAVRLNVYAAEVPDVTALTAAFKAALPAGIVGTVQVLIGWSVAQLETHFSGQTVANVESAYAGQTVADVERTLP